ncbi:NADP-dependent aldehyde dehydrogenase [Microbacterium sp. SLBN-154]|uniref:aldehyde dehydrogenase (NADP(+)) n=1 Tax=Microbacterium sp. SLBN-154 TaxID=2768458 RepID=UPI00114FD71B|nr:aldehyde dehydrogenase (NADP(+)) [Microbacterium sp. SLBN-154]TQK17692.1 NADP-dependent aldehyde dehydrogenase [Microbacterium sp. SLBN-154]
MPETLTTTDPRTGTRSDTGIAPTSGDEVAVIVARAKDAAQEIASRSRAWRARLLDGLADSLEEHRDRLVSTAETETGLTAARLEGELSRTTFQLRLFGEAVREGGFLEAAIDHATETPLGRQPDVRRMLVPVGPVAVFGSSNFPFAFSVPGGDTASALAAGNPVVVKAHSAHPLTSKVSYEALRAGAERVDAPEGTLGIVFGQQAGVTLVEHAAIAAVGFTGSLGAAQHLRAAIEGRPRPIPFYGELQSVNPLVITEAALRARGAEIAVGLSSSITASGGQLCTKPGIAFVPAGDAADQFARRLGDAVGASDPGVLLNERVLASFGESVASLEAAPGVIALTGATTPDGTGFSVAPRVLRVQARDLTTAHTIEAFGPLVLVVDYHDVDELAVALAQVPHSLTATLHVEDTDLGRIVELLPVLQEASGRIVFNGYPTGVRVSWAQHHGGPWPATNTVHTSVGVTAIRRFLRPLAWQNAPETLLPEELRDDFAEIPRRVDGALITTSRSGGS